MKVLKVLSKSRGISTYKSEQIEQLRENGVEVDIFYVTEGGVIGYIKSLIKFVKFMKSRKYDLIHSHDISSIICFFYKKFPIIMSFHGTDLEKIYTRIICNFISIRADYILLSNHKQQNYLIRRKDYGILNSGINMSLFYPLDKTTSRLKLGLDLDKIYILFAGSFSTDVKNYPLAKKALEEKCLNKYQIELVQMKGFSREEVALLMNCCDLLLVTSKSETGPNVTKEALASNMPVVTTKVGHKKLLQIIGNEEGCYTAGYDSKEIAHKIKQVIDLDYKINTRNNIEQWSMEKFIDNTILAYDNVITKRYEFIEFP